MKREEVLINNESGLHARPASQFVKTAGMFKSDIFIEYNGKKINAKSILGVLSGGIVKGSKIFIQAEGEDEEEAVNELVNLIKDKLVD